MDFSVIKRARMTQGEFADLVGVSRVTVNQWVRGKMRPHRYTSAKIGAMLEHLESAAEFGELPLPNGVSDRLAGFRAAVKQSVRRTRSAP